MGDARRKVRRPGRCNAERADGTFCWRLPMKKKKRCKRHGGDNPSGADHPSWKGGRSKDWLAKNLPERLLKTYAAIVADPELSSVRKMVALVGARIGELSAKLRTHESSESWAELNDMVRDAKHLITRGEKVKPSEMLAIFETMAELIADARKDYRVWDDILRAVEQYNKLEATEIKREAALQTNISGQQSLALFQYLYGFINAKIESEPLRKELADGLEKFLTDRRAIKSLSVEDAEIVDG